MFHDFINWSTVFSAMENIVFCSIPEEIFLVMFTLILLKQFDFLESKKEGGNKFKKRDIFEISIPVLLVAITSNVSRYYGVDKDVVLLQSVFLLFLSILIVYKLWTLSGVIKVFISVIISVLILTIFEISYIPLVLYATHSEVKDFNNSVFMNFLLALPERLMESCLIAYFLLKKSTFLKANIIKPIINSKILSCISIGMLFFNIIIALVMGKLFIFDKLLAGMSLKVQLFIIILVILIPVINITALLGSVYFVSNRERYKRYLAKEMLERLTFDLRTSSLNNKLDRFDLALRDIEANIEDLYLE